MLYLKSFHLIFLVAWFGGLFYLPRLFVYHTEIEPADPHYQRFCTMERKLFWGIMTPCAILALVMGLGLLHYWWDAVQSSRWMHAKLLLVGFLLFYHYQCYRYLKAFKEQRNTKSHIFYRLFNEIAIFLLIFIIFLVVFKPF